MSDQRRNEYRRRLRSLIIEMCISGGLLVLTFMFVFGVAVIHGSDMYPALKDGDIVLYYRTGSLVNTVAVVYEAGGGLRAGRIAASEGTVISASGDMQMTFDGIYMPASLRDGIYSRTYAPEGLRLPFTVRRDHYYILGDNRDSASDSRVYGQIDRKKIRGRIISVLRRRGI